MEVDLAADRRHADAIAVAADAAHDAVHDALGPRVLRPAEAQRVEVRDRPRAHREHVAQDAADAGRRALIRLDEARMVVALHLEHGGEPVADVDHARVLARSVDHPRRLRRQLLQPDARGFVRAMLRPHHAEHAEFGQVRRAAHDVEHPRIFLGAKAEFAGERFVDLALHRHAASAAAESVEQRLAVGAAHQRIDEILRMRHQAEHAQIGAVDAGDVARAAVAVGFRRDLARGCRIAEGDEVVAFEPVERVLVGEVVSVAMRHRGAEGLPALIMSGEGGIGALHPQVAIHGQKAERGVAEQRAGQDCRLRSGFGSRCRRRAHGRRAPRSPAPHA